MKSIKAILERATGRLTEISASMIPATAGRAIIFDDPGLAWMAHHGEANGFQKDSGTHLMQPFIFEIGDGFEAAYIRNECRSAVRMMEHDFDVRKIESFEKTLLQRASGGQRVAAGPR